MKKITKKFLKSIYEIWSLCKKEQKTKKIKLADKLSSEVWAYLAGNTDYFGARKITKRSKLEKIFNSFISKAN